MAVNSRGALTQICYVKETTYGVTPGSPTMILFRNKGNTMAMTKGSNVSLELRGDRQIHDFRHGLREPKGAINCEISYGDLDNALSALLCGTWTTETTPTPNTLLAGVTNTSWTVEVGYNDIAQYLRYTGCRFTSGSFSFKPSGTLCTVDFDIEAQDLSSVATSPLSGSPTAVSTNTMMDSFSATLNEASGSIAIVTGLDIKLDNKPSNATVIGAKTRNDIVLGNCDITGTVTALFQDVVLMNKFLNETLSELDITINGTPANRTLKIKLPAIKYSGGNVPVTNDGLLAINLPFQAIYDASTASTIQLTRSNV